MARIFTSGFETGSKTAAYTEWNGFLSSPNILLDAAYARSGGYGARFIPATTSEPEFTRLLANGVYTRYVRFYLFIPSGQAPTVQSHILNIAPYDGTNGTRTLQVVLNANRTLQARVGARYDTGTLVGSASPQLAFGTWYRIEARASYGAAGVVEVRIDGTAFVNTTFDYTGGTGYESHFAVGILPSSAGSTSKVEWYCDDAAADDAAFPGAGSVLALRPNAAGSSTQWTLVGAPANWDACEETPPDGDTSYVVTGVAANTDRYALTDPAGTIQSVTGVCALYVVRGEGTTARTIGVGHRLAGTVWEDAAYSAIHTAYKAIVGAFRTVTPAGGAWTAADLASVESHQRHVSGGNRLVRITCIFLMAEVVYAAEGPVSQTAAVPFEALSLVPAVPVLLIKAGDFLTRTTVGLQDITDVGFQPKCLLLFSGGATADDVEFGGAHVGLGLADGVTQRAAICDHRGSAYVDKVAATKNFATYFYAADWSAWLGNGFRLNYTHVDTSAREVMYLALGGAALSNVKVGEFALNTAAGPQDILGLGFQPDFVIFFHSERTALDTPGSFPADTVTGPLGLGAAQTSTRQWAINLHSFRGRWQRTDRCYLGAGGQSASKECQVSFVQVLPDGFRIDVVDTPYAAYKVAFIALKGPAARVGSFAAITTGGPTQDITSPGFQPRGTLLASHDWPASTSRVLGYGLELVVGFQSEPIERERVYWVTRDSSQSWSSQKYRNIRAWSAWEWDIPSTFQSAADISAFLSNGFRLNWVQLDSAAKQILFVSFGDTPTETEVEKTAVVVMESLLRLQRALPLPWESRGGIYRSLLSPWEASKGLASARLTAWEASSGRGRDSAATIEALLGVRVERQAVAEAAGAVFRLAQAPFETIMKLIEQAATVPYEAGGMAAASLLSTWEALQEIRREGVTPLETLAAAAAAQASALEALGRVASSALSPWETAGLVAALRLAPWETAGLAAALRLSAWESLAPLSSALLAPWEAAGRAARTYQLPWEAAGRAAAFRITPYEAAGEVPAAVPPLQVFLDRFGAFVLAVRANVRTGQESRRGGAIRYGILYTAGGGLVEIDGGAPLEAERVVFEVPLISGEPLALLYGLRDGAHGYPLIWKNAFNAGTEVIITRVEARAYPGGHHFWAEVQMERAAP